MAESSTAACHKGATEMARFTTALYIFKHRLFTHVNLS